MKNNVHKIFYCLIIILIIVVDQIVKYLSVVFLKPVSTIPVWDGVFHLTYCENTGAAFSIFEGARWFFIIITSLFVIFILFLVF
ncbi:MAG: signal peptidase II, partial [Clostridiales bacterium]|nr:signal peptidase II [Clostridiales bacterium]